MLIYRGRPCGALVLVWMSSCSDPNGYRGGGRLQALPGDAAGATLVASDASVGPHEAGPLPDAEGPSPVGDAGGLAQDALEEGSTSDDAATDGS